jgi:hypothetical protein
MLPSLLLQAATTCQPDASSEPWHNPSNLGWSCYTLPSVATALLAAGPRAPAGVWAQAVQAAAKLSSSAGRELAARAVSVHPVSRQLWELHVQLEGTAGERRKADAAAAMQALGL